MDLALWLYFPSVYTGCNRKYRMGALIPFLTLDQPSERVLTWINKKLSRAGFRVMQTFDLNVARRAHPDCPCPHHGTADCNCQMIVLLVYRNKSAPVTLVIHSQDGKTSLSLTNQVGGRSNEYIAAAIRRALVPRISEMPSSIEITYEARPTI